MKHTQCGLGSHTNDQVFLLLLILAISVMVSADQITRVGPPGVRNPSTGNLLRPGSKNTLTCPLSTSPSAGTPQHHERLKVLSASGLAPDVMAVDGMFWSSSSPPGFCARSTICWLPRSHSRMSDYFPPHCRTSATTGKHYGLPYISSPQYLVYNVTHVNEAGLPKPDFHWDWATFEEYVRKLTRSVDDRITRRGASTFTGAYAYWPWLWSAGTDVVDMTTRRFRLTEPEAIEVLDWLAQLQVAGFIGSGNVANQTTSMQAMYPAGFPTVTGATWPFEWDVTLPPAGPGGQYTIWKGNAMGISPSTKHLEEAWELTKFLLAPNRPGYNIYITNKRFPPQTRDSATWNLFHRPGEDPVSLRDVTLLFASEYSKPFPQLLQWAAIMTDTVRPALDRIFAGQVSARIAMEQIRPIVGSSGG